MPSRPALGLGAPFLVLAIGQVIGAFAFGTLYDALGAPATLVASGVLCFGAMVFGRAGRVADAAP
jgi:predicted MFS family arabinose efflux permease